MAEPLITIQQVEKRLGHSLPGALAGQAEAYCEDVSADARLHAEGLLDDVEDPDTPPAVVAILVSAVRRALDNPNAYSGQAIDGHQWQASGQTGVFLNEREIKRLRKAVGLSTAGDVTLEGYFPVQHPRQGFASGDDTLAELFPTT